MKQKLYFSILTSGLFLILAACDTLPKKTLDPLVLTTDFGRRDGAVSAMHGVASTVEPNLKIDSISHDIPPYDIWDAGYRIKQTYRFWPKGTVFVTVVDPGVGSSRKSIAIETNSGHFFVGPDNGHLTLVVEEAGIKEAVVINEATQRLKGSEDSYTFHGRDLYVNVGAKLASHQITLAQLGEKLNGDIVRLPHTQVAFANGVLTGGIPVLDVAFGNVWTDITKQNLTQYFPIKPKQPISFMVQIFENGSLIWKDTVPLVETFATVKKGAPLLYFNSLLNLSLAVNQGNFAEKYKISSGPEWTVKITPADGSGKSK